MLTLRITFNYVDRFARGVVLDDIKAHLRRGDSRPGPLSDMAFALYSVLVISIARWADRGDRAYPNEGHHGFDYRRHWIDR
jgi:hypothetical protein